MKLEAGYRTTPIRERQGVALGWEDVNYLVEKKLKDGNVIFSIQFIFLDWTVVDVYIDKEGAVMTAALAEVVAVVHASHTASAK